MLPGCHYLRYHALSPHPLSGMSLLHASIAVLIDLYSGYKSVRTGMTRRRPDRVPRSRERSAMAAFGYKSSGGPSGGASAWRQPRVWAGSPATCQAFRGSSVVPPLHSWAQTLIRAWLPLPCSPHHSQIVASLCARLGGAPTPPRLRPP